MRNFLPKHRKSAFQTPFFRRLRRCGGKEAHLYCGRIFQSNCSIYTVLCLRCFLRRACTFRKYKRVIQSRRCQQRQYIRLLRLQDLCFLRLKDLRFAE